MQFKREIEYLMICQENSHWLSHDNSLYGNIDNSSMHCKVAKSVNTVGGLVSLWADGTLYIQTTCVVRCTAINYRLSDVCTKSRLSVSARADIVTMLPSNVTSIYVVWVQHIPLLDARWTEFFPPNMQHVRHSCTPLRLVLKLKHNRPNY